MSLCSFIAKSPCWATMLQPRHIPGPDDVKSVTDVSFGDHLTWAEPRTDRSQRLSFLRLIQAKISSLSPERNVFGSHADASVGSLGLQRHNTDLVFSLIEKLHQLLTAAQPLCFRQSLEQLHLSAQIITNTSSSIRFTAAPRSWNSRGRFKCFKTTSLSIGRFEIVSSREGAHTQRCPSLGFLNASG